MTQVQQSVEHLLGLVGEINNKLSPSPTSASSLTENASLPTAPPLAHEPFVPPPEPFAGDLDRCCGRCFAPMLNGFHSAILRVCL